MPAATQARATTWWATQEPPVRAVLDLADLGDNEHLLDLLIPDPDLRREIINLGDDLVMIGRLRVDEPHAVLTELYGAPWRGWDGDLVCDHEADRLQDDVLTRAQLVASLLTAGGTR